MTASEKNSSPDFFEEHGPDPVSTATRFPSQAKPLPKKKAGFYLSEALLEKFNRHYHQMKLEGTPIENKSALLEVALEFALSDLEKKDQSSIMQSLLKNKSNRINIR